MAIKSPNKNYSIVALKDNYGIVLTYSVYSHEKQNFINEFNTLKEAREFVRNK